MASTSSVSLPSPIAETVRELQDRVATLLRDPDPATLAARAAAVFADHQPTWRHGVYQSADIQLAATSALEPARGVDPDETRADAHIRFSEMLPGPDACWLTDDDGRRYTSELRLVAVDRSALRDRSTNSQV